MANLKETAEWSEGIYQFETTDPVVGGPDGIDNKPLKQLANRTLYLKGIVDSLGNLKVNISVVITAGNGLTGGGNLAANRTISLGTPSSITSSSSNSVTGTSHTHALDNTGVAAGTYRSVTVDVKGRVTAGNPVQVGLITATTATGTANQATSNSNTFLNVYEKVGSASSSVGTSTQVTGTGYASVSSDTNGKLSINVTVPAASTTRRGEVQLIDSVENNSISTAATPNSVRVAYNKGVEALTRADGLATSKLDATANAVSASKWATARKMTLTGAISGAVSFDGSGDFTVNTTDNTVISLVTSTTSTGTTNVATSNSNTYLNVVETVNGVANATGSSTKVEGARGISVSSDTGGKLIITGMAYSDAVNSTSGSQLATSKAAKSAYDKGVEALNVANAKQSPATTLAGYGITDLVINTLSTEDLDTIKTVGSYAQPANANCTTERHYPKAEAGALLVLASTYGYQQQYTTFSSNEMYVRNIGNSTGTWSAWRRVDAQNKLDANATAVAANKLATARSISLTGAVTGSTTFDGSGNVSIATTDNLTISLVASSSATGTTNTSTSNSNTYLNVVETRGSSSKSLGSSTKLVGSGNVSVSSSTSGIVTIYGKDSDLVKIVSSIPTSKSNDVICVSSMRRNFYWMTIGAFTGYASAELGHGIFSSSKNPLPGTVLADGRTLTVASHKALYEYAKANGLMVASSAWAQGSFWFANLGNGNFKIPDMRGQFVRAVGPDPDNANVMMALGAYRQDKMQKIVGELYDLAYQDISVTYGLNSGAIYTNDNFPSLKAAPKETVKISDRGDRIIFDSSRVTRTGAETEPKNTALHYYIYVY